MEINWDEPIMKTNQNRPDNTIWHPEKQLCQEVGIKVPFDMNLDKARKEKEKSSHDSLPTCNT